MGRAYVCVKISEYPPLGFGVWVTYINATCNGTIFWVPTPWGLGEGQKGQISLNLNYKVNFKDFWPNFVYLLTNERYITYQRGFLFGRLGHAQGWDLGVPWGGGVGFNLFFQKFKQIWCVSYLHEWHLHRHIFWEPALWGLGERLKNYFFWTWYCGISNLRGWAVDQDRLKFFNLWSNWWPWDWVGSITIRFLRERGDLRWHTIKCVLVKIGNIGYNKYGTVHIVSRGVAGQNFCKMMYFSLKTVFTTTKFSF